MEGLRVAISLLKVVLPPAFPQIVMFFADTGGGMSRPSYCARTVFHHSVTCTG